MNTGIKQWLRQQLVSMDGIRACGYGRDADLIVHSWRSVSVQLHLLEKPTKTRSIKRIVQESTRVGIGSLFILNRQLVPADGVVVTPGEWLQVIHALTDDRIYFYYVDGGEPHIGQLHLRQVANLDEYEVVYGPEIMLTQLPFFRVWVKLPAIKGNWLVANFGSTNFWQPLHEQRQRHYQWTAWHYYHRRASNGAVGTGVTDNQLAECYAFLGLQDGAGCDEIKTAYRKLAQQLHPDVSELPTEEAQVKFNTLCEAYQYLRDIRECS